MDKDSNYNKQKMDLLVPRSSAANQDKCAKKTVCHDATTAKNKKPLQVFNMCEVTKNAPKVPFGPTKTVVHANVAEKLFTPSFIVDSMIEDYLGHSNFTVADHYVPGLVVVGFETEEDVCVVTAHNFKWGHSLVAFKKFDVITPTNPDASRLYKSVADDAPVTQPEKPAPFFRISKVTRHALKVEFGVTRNVVRANVVDRNFTPSFVVGATLESFLEHSKFIAADHYIHGVVLVASDDVKDVDKVTAHNFKFGGSIIGFTKLAGVIRAMPDVGVEFKAVTFPIDNEDDE